MSESVDQFETVVAQPSYAAKSTDSESTSALDNVVAQIEQNCACFADVDHDEVLTITKSFIRMLSSATCWSIEPCGSILLEPRREQIELGCFDFKCCDPIYRFRPYFQANVDQVQVKVLRQVGLTTEEYPLDDQLFATTDIHGFTEILVDIKAWARRCGCQNPCELLVLRFDYMAGYPELPECLFPDVCEVIKAVSASLSGCGSVAECCEMTQPQVGSRLKSKRVGELSWAWDKDTDSASYLFNQLIVANRFKSLGLVSLCGTDPDHPDVWAVHANNVTNRRVEHSTRTRFCVEEDCDEG